MKVRFLRLIGLVTVLLAILVLALCCYFYFAYPHTRADEILFALKAPAGKLAFVYVEPLLRYFLAPLLALTLFTGLAWKFQRGYALSLFILFLATGAFFFARYEIQSTQLVEFFVSEQKINHTTFIADNYANPDTVKITFPARKRNLIHIYLESVEATFADATQGGSFRVNVIPELTALALSGESFSGDSQKINGAICPVGTTWTMGAAFATETGLPLKISIGVNSMSSQNHFFEGLTALGDILEDAGYKTLVMKDVDMTFAGSELFYHEHGNYKVVDYKYANKHGLIPKDYFVWTGFEDKRLFEIAKKELTELSQGTDPFAFTLFTNDTHFPAGFVCDICPTDFPDAYSNVYHCGSRQVTDFINWIKEQPFYENTTIVLHGDHLTMAKDYAASIPRAKRRTFTAFLNTATHLQISRERQYTTFDFFPTILASIGARIPGDKLGLGVNLFSAQPTLVETLGIDRFNRELSAGSSFMEKLGKIDKRAGKTDLSKFCIRDMDCFLKSVKEAQSKDTLIVLALQGDALRYIKERDIKELQSLGLKADILGKGKIAYIAALTDKSLFEATGIESAEKQFSLSGADVIVRSVTGCISTASVAINGAEQSKTKEGINIVVYDLKANHLLASEAFATHKQSRKRIR